MGYPALPAGHTAHNNAYIKLVEAVRTLADNGTNRQKKPVDLVRFIGKKPSKTEFFDQLQWVIQQRE